MSKSSKLPARFWPGCAPKMDSFLVGTFAANMLLRVFCAFLSAWWPPPKILLEGFLFSCFKVISRRSNVQIFKIFLLAPSALAVFNSLLAGMRAKNEQFSLRGFWSDFAFACDLCFLNTLEYFSGILSSTLFLFSQRGRIACVLCFSKHIFSW